MKVTPKTLWPSKYHTYTYIPGIDFSGSITALSLEQENDLNLKQSKQQKFSDI